MAKEDDKKLTLYSGQATEGTQEQKTESESTQQSSQTQRTVFDPEGTDAARKALDPFYRRAEEDGAVRAFLDTYAKPDPADAEREARAARGRRQAAVLAESLRLISDMGAGFAGGNVYDRGGAASKSVAAAKDEADRAQERYRAELERFNAGLLSARQADIARRDALDRLALQYGTRTESTSEGKGSSSSSSQGKSKSEGTGWQQQQVRATGYGSRRSGGSGSGGSTGGDMISTVPVLGKDGKPAYRALVVPEETSEEFYREASRIILATDYLRKMAQERFGGKEATEKGELDSRVRDALGNADIETSTEGGRKAAELRKTIVRDLLASDPMLQSILKHYGGGIAYEEGDVPYQSTGIVGTEYDNYRVRMPGTAPSPSMQDTGGTAAAQTDFSFPD